MKTAKLLSRMVLCLAVAALLAGAVLPAEAGAYIGRSSGAASAYWIARSTGGTSGPATRPAPYPSPAPAPKPSPAPTPKPLPSPAPAPRPAYYYGSGSYYIARSTGGTSGPTTRPAPDPSPAPAPKPPEPAPSPKPDPQPPQLPGETAGLTADERLLLNLVNGERISRGLAPLKVNNLLVQLARLKSRDMLENNYFAHQSPTYGSCGDMLRSAGVGFSLAAENIGMGGSVRAIFSAFMDSSGHRNKILGSSYTETGIGIAYQPGKGYRVTQIFIRPK